MLNAQHSTLNPEHQVKEKQLETVVPKVGGLVMVLTGEFKGRRGRLMAKDKEREVASVQIAGDMSVETVKMDDIAEYVGQDTNMMEY